MLPQLPYCLLRARADFMKMANSDAADYDENLGRGVYARLSPGARGNNSDVFQRLRVKF